MTTEEVKAEIDDLFSDTSVPVATTRERMEELREHIGMLLESLPDDSE
jgi:hypothetical protein